MMQEVFAPIETMDFLSRLVIQSREHSLDPLECSEELLDRVKRVEEMLPVDEQAKNETIRQLNELQIPLFRENLIASLQIELRIAKLVERRYEYVFDLLDCNGVVQKEARGVLTDFHPVLPGSPSMRFRCLPELPIPPWIVDSFVGAANRTGEKVLNPTTRKEVDSAFWVPFTSIIEGKVCSKGSRYRIFEQRLGVLASAC